MTVWDHANLLCQYMLAAFFHPNFMFWSVSLLSDPFPPTEISDEGLAKPVVAGIVATICFLAAAILFSTLAACFVNKQHRRKLKRKRGESFKTFIPVFFCMAVIAYHYTVIFRKILPLFQSC